jgi:hypothetical protein
MYTKTADGIALVYPYYTDNLIADNPQTSFPSVISDELLAEYEVFPVVVEPNPPYDPATQYIETANLPTLIDGIWVQTKTVVNMTPAQIQARDDRLRGDNKSQATTLLQQTDWTTIPDVSDPAVSDPYLVNSAEFAAYRNQVRKIAVNPPVVAVFPTMPTEIWSE